MTAVNGLPFQRECTRCGATTHSSAYPASCACCRLEFERTFGATPAPMTEARARELMHLSEKGISWDFVQGEDCQPRLRLDSLLDLSADELEAFAWWLRNKPNETP